MFFIRICESLFARKQRETASQMPPSLIPRLTASTKASAWQRSLKWSRCLGLAREGGRNAGTILVEVVA